MKKIVAKMVVVLLCACSFSALATISVNWFTVGTIYLNDGTTQLPVGSIAQLIWSPDSTISPYNDTDALVPDSTEVLLMQFTTTDVGGIWVGSQNYVEEDYGIGDTNGFANGYVYARVFNYLAVDGSPTNDTWFAEGAVPLSGPVASQHVSGTPPDPTLADITGGSDFSLNDQVVVPEPMTMAIMGIGLLTLVSRRFRRK